MPELGGRDSYVYRGGVEYYDCEYCGDEQGDEGPSIQVVLVLMVCPCTSDTLAG